MTTTLITGATRSGKTEALRRHYLQWLQEGLRTDQILILTAGAHESAQWCQGLALPAQGPIEAYSFYAFIQQELLLHWAPVQAAVPALRRWLRPDFLPPDVARQLMRGLVEPFAALFGDAVKASPERIALQLLSGLDRVGAAFGLEPDEAAQRLARADLEERAPLYGQLALLGGSFRQRCLEAGMLDYGLSLYLFTRVLLPDPGYRQHLQRRFRRLLVDDLDETQPVEQEFLAALAGALERALLAYNPEGGHARFMGADPEAAYARFAGADRVALPAPERDLRALLADAARQRFSAELWGEMVAWAAEQVARLVAEGTPPAEIALIAPRVDNLLAVSLRQALAARGIPLHSLSATRRLLDEPPVRSILALAGLTNPDWRRRWQSGGLLAQGLQYLLRLQPAAASQLGEGIRQAQWELPAAPEQWEPPTAQEQWNPPAVLAYRRLAAWLAGARRRTWTTDAFAQAALLELLLPLRGGLTSGEVAAVRQYLRTLADFRQALERFGDDAFGPEYRPLLTEATAALWPEEPEQPAVLLTTPYGYLSRWLTTRYQIWLDASSPAWLPSDVRELFNPHVLSPRWQEGDRWTDALAARTRRTNGERLVRALLHRCTGRVLMAECAISASGREQEGGVVDLALEGGSWL